MRQQRVVVVRQEPDRRRQVGLGQEPVRDVEQLAAGLVAERVQPRPEPLEHRPHPRQAGPRRDVRHRRGTERREVAQHGIVRGGVAAHRPPDRVVEGAERRLRDPSPGAARRDLVRGQQVPHRVGERRRVAVREALAHRRPELAQRPRPLLDQRPPEVQHRPDVHPLEAHAPGPVAVQLGIEHGLHDRPQRQRILDRDQVDRRAHERHPDQPAGEHVLGDDLGIERVDARPQRDVGRGRHLGLEADEVVDDLDRRRGHPRQQELPGEQGAVERAGVEHRDGHGGRLRDAQPVRGTVPSRRTPVAATQRVRRGRISGRPAHRRQPPGADARP